MHTAGHTDTKLRIDTYGMLDMHVDDVIGQSVAVLGIKGSGKSNTSAVLMEELLRQGVPICVIDIAGEYGTLRDEFEIAVVGRSVEIQGDDILPITFDNVERVARTAYLSGKSVIFDISGYDDDGERDELVALWARAVLSSATRARIPCVFFLEEAHNFMPQGSKTASKSAWIRIATEGRKRGLSLVMIGQRSSRIDKDTLTQADVCLLHRVRHPADLRVYEAIIPRAPRHVRNMVNRLGVGDAIVLWGERVLTHKVRKRITQHVGYTPTLDAVPDEYTQASLLDLLDSLEK